jgi:hypothetical protein
MPYFINIGRAADNVINFFNPDDSVLFLWRVNQDAKPDAGYSYDSQDGRFELASQPLAFPSDTYEIFAHAAEAWSNAAGAQPNLGGAFDRIRQVDLREYDFGDTILDHSGQFTSTNMRRHPYWQRLLEGFNL